MLETFLLVILAVALRDGEAVVHIVEPHRVVSHILDQTSTSTTGQGSALFGIRIWPDLDARTLGGVVHGRVDDRDILDIVDPFWVLAQAADGDTMRSVAAHVLHQDIGRVRLE